MDQAAIRLKLPPITCKAVPGSVYQAGGYSHVRSCSSFLRRMNFTTPLLSSTQPHLRHDIHSSAPSHKDRTPQHSIAEIRVWRVQLHVVRMADEMPCCYDRRR